MIIYRLSATKTFYLLLLDVVMLFLMFVFRTERGWKESSLDTTVPSSTKLNNESTKGKLEKSIKQNENTSMSRDKRSYSDVTLKRQQVSLKLHL